MIFNDFDTEESRKQKTLEKGGVEKQTHTLKINLSTYHYLYLNKTPQMLNH